ncbi:hypothetical protein SDC9_175300 [bioreactor metagenome]|uniref:Uncharacterized protein n=1 Tax=bioreactor metagenome TaxID=1076179 RepID=A0A645GNV9_9ZZZZ
MTYRNDGSYLKFWTFPETANKLMDANEEIDLAIAKNKNKLLLRDNPAIKSNQNVYDFLSD